MVDTKPALEFKTNWQEFVNGFEELNLKPDLLRGIYDYGLSKPTLIQSKGILPLIKKKSLIAKVPQSGGKTSTLVIATLQVIDTNLQTCQALILTPTRELALQAHKMIVSLGEHLKVSAFICMGENTAIKNHGKLEEEVQVVVGTPKTVYDMINKDFLKLDNLKLLAIDEGDEILCRGFRQEIKEIFSHMKTRVQIAVFASTMPSDVLELIQNVKDPAMILEENKELKPKDIKQFYVALAKEEWKFDTLVELMDLFDVPKFLIYCNKPRTVDELTTKLQEKNYHICPISNSVTFAERDYALQEFKTGACRFFVCNDFIQEGVDVPTAPLVINYDLPVAKERYLLRMGMTVTGNNTKALINFVTPSDQKFLREVEMYFEVQINELPMDVSGIFD